MNNRRSILSPCTETITTFFSAENKICYIAVKASSASTGLGLAQLYYQYSCMHLLHPEARDITVKYNYYFMFKSVTISVNTKQLFFLKK